MKINLLRLLLFWELLLIWPLVIIRLLLSLVLRRLKLARACGSFLPRRRVVSLFFVSFIASFFLFAFPAFSQDFSYPPTEESINFIAWLVDQSINLGIGIYPFLWGVAVLRSVFGSI